MSIKGNVGYGVIAIGITDTVLIDLDTDLDRAAITALSLHNDGSAAGPIDVEIFVSPDLTSASGERVAKYTITDNSSADVVELIGEGIAEGDENIIAVADVVGCNAMPTVTEYDDGD